MDASSLAKRRLKAILDQIGGKLSVEEACASMNVGESVFFDLRASVLQAALGSLEPGRAGRPSKQTSDVDDRLATLEEEMQLAKIELQAARIREEIAVTMPHVLQRRSKKNR